MDKIPIKLGPLALILTVISICLTTLAILTCATAGADMRLAEKYAENVRTRYALEAEAQRSLAELGENGETELQMDGYTMSVRVENGKITDWRRHKSWEADESLGGDLWIAPR